MKKSSTRFNSLNSTLLPTLQSNHLFAMTKEVLIEHNGEKYRLRLTRKNQLILTKQLNKWFSAKPDLVSVENI